MTRTTLCMMISALTLTAGCVLNPEPERPDDLLEIEGVAYGEAGWDGVRVEVYEVTWELVGKRTLRRWERVEDPVSPDTIDWVFTGPEGQVVAGEVDLVGGVPVQRIVPVDGALTVGTWQLSASWQGEALSSVEVVVGSFGQDDRFDVDVLEGHVQLIGEFSDSLFSIADLLIGELALHVEPTEEGKAQVALYAPGKQVPWCRAWTGEAELGEQGLLEVEAESLLAGGSVEAEIRDLRLVVGFDQLADVAGVEVLGTMDTRDIDFAFASENEEPREGDACDTLGKLGVECQVCEDSGESFCMTYKAWAGRTVATGVVPTVEELAEAPLCAGPEDGEVAICSTVGTVGIGAWFAGLGVVLFRRRRRPAQDS